MYSECDEIADTMRALKPGTSYSYALRLTRAAMPDESEVVISNVAWARYSAANDPRRCPQPIGVA